jgi:hypothetical protein
MGHKSPSDWVSGFQTGFWQFPWLRNQQKLNCKITDAVGDGGGFGGASEGAEGFEALVSYHEVGSGCFWVGEAV